jgi:hypothetical protein
VRALFTNVGLSTDEDSLEDIAKKIAELVAA